MKNNIIRNAATVLSAVMVSFAGASLDASAEHVETIDLALDLEDRVNEIIYNVFESIEDEHILNYVEAAVCISQVAGLSDNAVKHPLYEGANDDDITIWSTNDVYRRYFIGDYLNTIGYATVFPPKHEITEEDEKSFYKEWGIDMIESCIVEYAADLSANCIVYKYKEPMNEMANRGVIDKTVQQDKLMTISELKELLKRMYLVNGYVYYGSDLDGGEYGTALHSDECISYYERYKKRMIFDRKKLNINGSEVSVLENAYGSKMVSFRELCNALGINIVWNDGVIDLDYKGEKYNVRLDIYQKNTKILIDKNIYSWHPVPQNEIFVDLDKSFTCYGQYEMVNDSIYLYPETFLAFIDHIGIDLCIDREDVVGTSIYDVVKKDYNRMSNREPIGMIITEPDSYGPGGLRFVRQSGAPVYIDQYEYFYGY